MNNPHPHPEVSVLVNFASARQVTIIGVREMCFFLLDQVILIFRLFLQSNSCTASVFRDELNTCVSKSTFNRLKGDTVSLNNTFHSFQSLNCRH